MTRGVAHSPETRAQSVAAVLAGASVAATARQYGLSKQTVSRWVNETGGTHQRARDPETIGDLIYDLIIVHLEAVSAQLQAVSRPEWLEKQTATDVAQLLGAERDTLIRLLAGLRPIRDESDAESPALDSPRPPDSAGG
jgi:transposase-like protein